MDPVLILLCDDSQLDLTKKKQKLLLSGFTAAKKVLVQRWLPPHDLSMRKWLTYFHEVVLLERSAARINKARPSTIDLWSELASRIKAKLLEV